MNFIDFIFLLYRKKLFRNSLLFLIFLVLMIYSYYGDCSFFIKNVFELVEYVFVLDDFFVCFFMWLDF